jgi:hypothetical protein
MTKQEYKKVKKKATAEGLILGVIGFILFFDFMSVDASIFNFTPPQIITQISGIFQISPIMIDILTTIALLTLIGLIRTEKQEGRLE